jgi:hypothetical protein
MDQPYLSISIDIYSKNLRVTKIVATVFDTVDSESVLILCFFRDLNLTLFYGIALLFSFVLQCHYVYCIIDEITIILDIRCFITKQTTQRRMVMTA